jgi:hypothetical protein
VAAAIAITDQAAALTLDNCIVAGNLTRHDLFQQQTATMLKRADLSDEQKQSILIAMNCPCCGAGGMSFTAKLKRGGEANASSLLRALTRNQETHVTSITWPKAIENITGT